MTREVKEVSSLSGIESFQTLIILCYEHAKLCQSCLTLCDPKDCSPARLLCPWDSRGKILEWVAMPSSRGSSQPRDGTCISYIFYIGRRVLYYWRHLGRLSLKIFVPIYTKRNGKLMAICLFLHYFIFFTRAFFLGRNNILIYIKGNLYLPISTLETGVMLF